MILFVDFDGVMHPVDAEGADLFCCRARLWEVLRRNPDTSVVFSSSWRAQHTLEAMIGYVTAGGGEDLVTRFVGSTPDDIDHDTERESRLKECLSWLAENGRDRVIWIAIDDIPELFGYDKPIYIVKSQHGLRDHDIEGISAMIRRLRR